MIGQFAGAISAIWLFRWLVPSLPLRPQDVVMHQEDRRAHASEEGQGGAGSNPVGSHLTECSPWSCCRDNGPTTSIKLPGKPSTRRIPSGTRNRTDPCLRFWDSDL
jgi:hypothetical protein